jgi:hypothetical protein
MKAADIFGLIIRVVGLFLTLWGIWYLLAALYYLPSTISSLLTHTEAEASSVHYSVYGVPAVLVGIAMLFFAHRIVEVSYRFDRRTPPLSPEK